jgi:hypothetical protein
MAVPLVAMDGGGEPRPARRERNGDACGYESPTRARTPACGRGELNSELLRVDIM